jgi:hypothetical protein
VIAALLMGCGLGDALLYGPGHPVTSPVDAIVDVSMPTLQFLNAEDRAKVELALAAHPHWDLRELHGQDACSVAVRMEPDSEGRYQPSLNGFYSDFYGDHDVVQTRVLLTMDCMHGYGRPRGVAVETHAEAGATQLNLENDESQPGKSSYLVIQSPSGLNLEVMEQSQVDLRTYTQTAMGEIEDTLQQALAGTLEILSKAGAAELVVAEGMQPGIYQLRGWVNPGVSGLVYAKVRYAGPAHGETPPTDVQGKEGELLSADRVEPKSIRTVAFGADPDVQYPYRSEVTVYEGDWGAPYTVSMELWLRPQDGGAERMLVSQETVIEGWMR